MKSRSSGKRAPSTNAAPKPKPTFRKAGTGIEAHGHVSSLGEHYDGADAMNMTVKHGKPKAGGDGIFNSYPDESRFTMDADAARQFQLGDRVRIRVHKVGDADDAPAKGKAKKSGAKR